MPVPFEEIIDIVQIGERTSEEDGISRPFRCEGADGANYYVKLKNAGYAQIVREWVAGRLAEEMGLRPAVMKQVRIDRALVEGALARELGHGIGFGSRRVESGVPLSMELVRTNPSADLARILLFDYWVMNDDRVLTEIGGNPNLIWSRAERRVVMIDQDKAFGDHFDPEDFRRRHALRDFREGWLPERRDEMLAWLERGLGCFDRIWDELPDEWLIDGNLDPLPGGLDKEAIRAILNRPMVDPDDFWS